VDLLKVDVEGMEVLVLEELERSGKFDLVARVVVEYGLHTTPAPDALSSLLALFERNSFRYAIDARSGRPIDAFQSVTIRAWRCQTTSRFPGSSSCLVSASWQFSPAQMSWFAGRVQSAFSPMYLRQTRSPHVCLSAGGSGTPRRPWGNVLPGPAWRCLCARRHDICPEART
jgi:hypothetical protein